MSTATDTFLYLLAAVGTILAVYGLAVGLRGLRPEPIAPPARTRGRYAVLVPAHNEERVLEPLLRSLEAQRYPRERFDVYVSADHCTDATAEIARRCGAVALERNGQARRGKTWNVRWALARLPVRDYDAVVIVDADNLAHPDFLAAINDHLEAHPDAVAVQGNLDVKNPDDSWVTRAIAVSYWFTNRFVQSARARQGLCCMLGGTGMALRPEAILGRVERLESLVDDLELTTLLALDGQTVRWCERAVVFDEKPVTLAASLRQRQRWMQGHFWLLARLGPSVLAAFLRSRRMLHLDLLVILASPAVALLGLGAGAVQLVHWLATAIPAGRASLAEVTGWLLPSLAVVALPAVAGPSMRFGRLTLRYLAAVPGCLVFSLSWLWALVAGLACANDQGQWSKTEHTRAITASELE